MGTTKLVEKKARPLPPEDVVIVLRWRPRRIVNRPPTPIVEGENPQLPRAPVSIPCRLLRYIAVRIESRENAQDGTGHLGGNAHATDWQRCAATPTLPVLYRRLFSLCRSSSIKCGNAGCERPRRRKLPHRWPATTHVHGAPTYWILALVAAPFRIVVRVSSRGRTKDAKCRPAGKSHGIG